MVKSESEEDNMSEVDPIREAIIKEKSQNCGLFPYHSCSHEGIFRPERGESKGAQISFC